MCFKRSTSTEKGMHALHSEDWMPRSWRYSRMRALHIWNTVQCSHKHVCVVTLCEALSESISLSWLEDCGHRGIWISLAMTSGLITLRSNIWKCVKPRTTKEWCWSVMCQSAKSGNAPAALKLDSAVRHCCMQERSFITNKQSAMVDVVHPGCRIKLLPGTHWWNPFIE